MFIVSTVQHIKVGDLSMHQSGLPLSEDAPGEGLMNVDSDYSRLPDGTDIGDIPRLTKDEERTLVRDSTAGFAGECPVFEMLTISNESKFTVDWVTSLFRRVLALYENLPEEGGKKNMTGGKQEESILKSIKSMLDVVCLHLSSQLFDLVLNLVYNYATTNAKSNAVRAFGQLVACLAQARPKQTIAKFLPYCISQIEDELEHGASSIRTTSNHEAAPSDTTLHWSKPVVLT
jgi:proteasome activator subunit 4